MAVIELDQAFETPVTEYRRGAISVRYAYSRSKETIENSERGQDYLVFKTTSNKICFALCDGVGNSFFGGIGAQILGESIIKWLDSISLDDIFETNEVERVTNDLKDYLDELSGFGREVVATRDLSGFPETQQQAYKNQIVTGGTQSNFTCGIIESPTIKAPKGRFLLFWLGDARLRIFKGTEELTKLINAKWDTGEKWGEGQGWSSKDGVVGHICTYLADLTTIDSVISHSDGFKLLEKQVKPGISSETLNQALKTLRNLKRESDDISFIEITVSDEVYDSSEDIVEMVRAHESAKSSKRKDDNSDSGIAEPPIARNTDSQGKQNHLGQTRPNNLPKQKFPNNVQGRTWLILIIVLLSMFFVTTFLCGFFAGMLYQIDRSEDTIITTIPGGINDPQPQTPTPTRFLSQTPTFTISPTSTLTITSTLTASPTETLSITPKPEVNSNTTVPLVGDGLITVTIQP